MRLISDGAATAAPPGGIVTASTPEPDVVPADVVPADVVPADVVPASVAAEASREDSAPPAPTLPPLPNYDQLSVASLRARLRILDVTQVRELADYERAHAARADVIAMFERRIVKLEAEA